MKALTLHQPWASLVALGAQTIVTRDWSTKYRGPLAIHAGKTPTDWLGAPCSGFDRPFLCGDCGHAIGQHHEGGNRVSCAACGHDRIRRPDLPLGAVVATCTLVEVVPTEHVWFDHHEHEPYIGCGRLFASESQAPYGDFTPGRFALLLDDVKPTSEPIPWRGRQGPWPVPPELAELLS